MFTAEKRYLKADVSETNIGNIKYISDSVDKLTERYKIIHNTINRIRVILTSTKFDINIFQRRRNACEHGNQTCGIFFKLF